MIEYSNQDSSYSQSCANKDVIQNDIIIQDSRAEYYIETQSELKPSQRRLSRNINILIFLIGALCLIFAGSVDAVGTYPAVDPNMVLYYHFYNDSSVGENSTRVYDYSNLHNNNGTIIGGFIWNSTGNYLGNGSIIFNTTNYVSVPDANSLSPWSNTNITTFAIWFKIYNDQTGVGSVGTQYIFGKGASNNFEYDLSRTNSTDGKKINFKLYNLSGSQTDTVTLLTGYTLNKWYFATLVLNGTHIIPYLNGVKGTAVAITRLDGNGTTNLNVGTRSNTATGPTSGAFNGTVGDFIIWNRTLTQSEVETMYYNYIQDNLCTTNFVEDCIIFNSTNFNFNSYSLNDSSCDGAVQIGNNNILVNGNGLTLQGNFSSCSFPFNFNNLNNITLNNFTLVDYSGYWNISSKVYFTNITYRGNNIFAIDDEFTTLKSNYTFKLFSEKDSGFYLGRTTNYNFTFLNSYVYSNSSLLGFLWTSNFDIGNVIVNNSYIYGMNNATDTSSTMLERGNLYYFNNTMENSRGITNLPKDNNHSTIILNSRFINTAFAISLSRSDGTTSFNHVANNIINMSQSGRISSQLSTTTNKAYGIFWTDLSNGLFENNTLYLYENGYGIDGAVSNFNNVTISNNRLYGLGDGYFEYIVLAKNGTTTISNNYIEGRISNSSGIAIGDSSNNRILNNIINVTFYNSSGNDFGINVYGASTNNTFYNNSVYGVQNCLKLSNTLYDTLTNFTNNYFYNCSRYDFWNSNIEAGEADAFNYTLSFYSENELVTLVKNVSHYFKSNHTNDFEYFSFNGSTNSISTMQSFNNSNALFHNGTNLCTGSSSNINSNDGNINITLLPSNYCYVLDNYNITIGVSRQNDPIWDSTTNRATNNLGTTIIFTMDGLDHQALVYSDGSVDTNLVGPHTITLDSGEWVQIEDICSTFTGASFTLIMLLSAMGIVVFVLVYGYRKWEEGIDTKDLLIVFIGVIVSVILWQLAGQNLGGTCPVS